MFLTDVQQGKFTSDGKDRIIKLRSGVDWIKIYNYTNMDASVANSTGFYWQKGMDKATAFKYSKEAASDILSGSVLASPNGLTLVNSVKPLMGDEVSITGAGITNADPPVVNATAHGYQTGDIVRIFDAEGAYQLSGIDYQITKTSDDAFQLTYQPQIADAPNADNAGKVRKVIYDTYWYPRTRYITGITKASSAVVSMSVDHTMKVGQEVRLEVPEAYGMRELNGKRVTITAVTDNTITVDVDSSNFTAFSFPTTGDVPFTQAMVVPFGEDTPTALANNEGILNDALHNTGYIGIHLPGGDGNPAGANNDVIYWIAGKSTLVDNK